MRLIDTTNKRRNIKKNEKLTALEMERKLKLKAQDAELDYYVHRVSRILKEHGTRITKAAQSYDVLKQAQIHFLYQVDLNLAQIISLLKYKNEPEKLAKVEKTGDYIGDMQELTDRKKWAQAANVGRELKDWLKDLNYHELTKRAKNIVKCFNNIDRIEKALDGNDNFDLDKDTETLE